MCEFGTLVLSLICIGMYGAKKVFGNYAVEALEGSASGKCHHLFYAIVNLH